jgi:hypothetical protein
MHQRRAVCRNLIFVGWKLKRCRNSMKTTATAQWLYRCSEVCRNWLICSKINEQVPVMKNDQWTSPLLLKVILNKSVLIFNKKWVPIDEVANQLQTGFSSAYEIIHHKPHFCTVCARWVPKQLTEQHIHNLLNQNYHIFFKLNWCWWQNVDPVHWARQYGMETPIILIKNLKSHPIAGKVVFWDSQKPILEHYQERGVTIVHITMKFCMISWSWWFRVNTEGIWQKMMCCCKRMSVPILSPTLFRQFRHSRNYDLRS